MVIPAPDQTYDEIIQHKTIKLNGEVAYKRYGKRKFLGKGGFAKCYEGINLQTKNLVAIKVVQKSTLTKNRAKQKLLSQIKIHKTLHHKNIVQFDSVFEDSACVYMILQLCPNKTLSEMVKRRKHLTVQQTRYYILELLSAIQYMHKNRVIHRDLKMGNIFLNESMDIKVGDFGLAAKLQFNEQKKRTMCGTPNYIAPEIVEGVSGHSYEVDVWSTGVICYALMFGRPPFETNEVKSTYKKIKCCEYNFPNQNVPNSAKSFIQSILVLDPKKRLTVSEMLQHPFLTGSDIPKSIPLQALTTNPTFEQPTNSTTSNTPKQSTNLIQQSPSEKITLSEKIIKKSISQTTGIKQPPSTMQALKYIKTDYGKLMKRLDSGGGEQKKSDIRVSAMKSARQGEFKEDVSKKDGVTRCQTKEVGANQHRINIICFVDYSTKYGLGYLINNHTYGVYFNDSSLMSVDGNKKTITYIQNPSSKQQNIQLYPYAWRHSNTLPTDKNFQKKFMLLEKFIVYLNDQVAKSNIHQSTYEKYDEFIYVKQWLKTKHAIMFRLSNKLFQVNFFDGSQILLNTEQKTVLFTSKKGGKIYQSLANALQAKDTEMARRIKYTKQILNSIKKGKDQLEEDNK